METIPPTVQEIFVSERGSAPMQRVDEVEAVAGKGLQGDRYMLDTGYWSGVDACQVTLISATAIEAIATETGIAIEAGQHRRNIIVSGMDVLDLAGKRFRIGEALFEYEQPRPPCRYIQSITQEGMTKALGHGRGGICVKVLESGLLRTGDPIEPL
ncbi:MAG: MOSC domain-containing protein [Actinomycetota bacterium]